MDFDLISNNLKKSLDVFMANIVAYIVGILIACIGSCLFITMPPLMYGLYYMGVKGSRGDKVEIKDVFAGFKSVSVFIRSWIFFIIPLVIAIIFGVVIGIVISFAATVSSGLAFAISLLCAILYIILAIVLVPVIFYSIYIYIMTPSENVIYAYKEGFGVFKKNILMTIVAIIITYLVSLLFITTPIGIIFTAYVLKALKPDLKDNAN